MQQLRATIVGIKFFDGDVDGKTYKSTTLFALFPLENNGRQKGMSVAELKSPDPALYKKLEALPFPLEADISVEQVVARGQIKMEVVDVKPVGRVNVATGEVAAVAAKP
ncbi:hypothetical protein SAMN02745857_04330 [Andreprevotia lacus DSM 23236]|uniref:Uncharacterized protein n=1 Tax=Andreprevotia lacus DSM 23236 TaxID=1121001 RepID=A0A1W1Y1G1_9NEIS|nr:hypothetical protein [Andreprevotia lacus]SMC29986.1 hypothetical protein SAMN02745857_04330 [Andreprevotia lacus DSM 23236]